MVEYLVFFRIVEVKMVDGIFDRIFVIETVLVHAVVVGLMEGMMDGMWEDFCLQNGMCLDFDFP